MLDVLQSYTVVTPRLKLEVEGRAGQRQEGEGEEEAEQPADGLAAEAALVEAASNSQAVVERKVSSM